ncbi:MAG: hypothetical protein ACRYGK_08595 [Janthinobacterium lividum]
MTEFTANAKVLQSHDSQSFFQLLLALSKLKQLRRLELNSKLPGFDLAHQLGPLLQQSSTLEYLCFYQRGAVGNQLNGFAQALKQNTSLQYLKLVNLVAGMSKIPLPGNSSAAVFQALTRNRSLRTLVMRGAEQSLESGLALARLLRKNFVLEQLDLDFMYFQNEDIKPEFFRLLMQGLAANTGLRGFTLHAEDLSINEPLSMMLHENCTLESLSLHGVINSVEDMLSLATALEGNFSLKELGLAFSSPCAPAGEPGSSGFDSDSDDGSIDGVLALMAGKNGLRRLSLNNCGIADSAGLARALASHPQLSMLDLSHNPLDDSGMRELLQVVAGHPCLSVLRLNAVFIDYDDLMQFARKLAQRNLPLYLELDSRLFIDTPDDTVDVPKPPGNWVMQFVGHLPQHNLPLYPKLDSSLFNDEPDDAVEIPDPQGSRVSARKADLRGALLLAQADTPHLVIRDLGHAMAMQRDWNWRDLVND